MAHPLLEARDGEATIEQLLRPLDVFTSFLHQDSGCVAWGVEVEGKRWFVKHSDRERAVAGLRRARDLNAAVQHGALPRLHHAFATREGFALIFDWVDGEVLYAAEQRGEVARSDPRTAHSRLRALPAPRIFAALETIYDLHVELARRGFVAVDFYDGSILYDFAGHRTWVCDLDCYRSGPFVLEEERLPGSTRFMAPEEFERGARIDGVTNVFTLGRTALILLGDGSDDPAAWKGNASQRVVALRASRNERAQRYPSVAEFASAWRAASG